jgi:hypothetical protein
MTDDLDLARGILYAFVAEGLVGAIAVIWWVLLS